jgi:RNA polymerase sigma factor (sigma-70 family)
VGDLRAARRPAGPHRYGSSSPGPHSATIDNCTESADEHDRSDRRHRKARRAFALLAAVTSRIRRAKRLIGVPFTSERTGCRLPPFSTVLEEHGAALLRFCLAQTGSRHGEDVFQETMISALRAYNTVRDPSAVKAWLFSIAARKAIDAHRATARAPIPLAEIDVPEQEAAAPDLEIWDEVARLPGKQRQSVALRFLGELSHREIAEVMQISEAAARRNVFEALNRLRGDLAQTALARNPDQPSNGEMTP